VISAESHRGRRIVGTLDRGADLFDALRAVCQRHEVRSGELRVTGSLERADLSSYDQAARQWKPTRSLEGGLELLQLSGTIAEESGALVFSARAALMRDRDTGVEVVGGHLSRAVVFSIEFVIDSFDDLLLRRQRDPDTGLGQLHELLAATTATQPMTEPVTSPMTHPVNVNVNAPEPVPAPAPGPAPTPTPVFAPQIVVHAGDVLTHPKFGRTTIMRLEGDQEFVHVRLSNGRVVRLSLDVITLQPRGTEDGQRVFEARID